jgi:hypothetical protein
LSRPLSHEWWKCRIATVRHSPSFRKSLHNPGSRRVKKIDRTILPIDLELETSQQPGSVPLGRFEKNAPRAV